MIRRILALLATAAVCTLLVKSADAECPVDPWHFGWSFSGVAYYNNAGSTNPKAVIDFCIGELARRLEEKQR